VAGLIALVENMVNVANLDGRVHYAITGSID